MVTMLARITRITKTRVEIKMLVVDQVTITIIVVEILLVVEAVVVFGEDVVVDFVQNVWQIIFLGVHIVLSVVALITPLQIVPI